MRAAFRILHANRTCAGRHLVLGVDFARSGPRGTASRFEPGPALAGVLGEAEYAEATPVSTVTLRLTRPSDAGWAAPALRWLHSHGRRVIVRTCVIVPRELVVAADECGATFMLELAHQRAELQRALIAPEANAAAALLLQAQHLRQRSIGVGVHLGPLFPAIHGPPGAERARGRRIGGRSGGGTTEPLLCHVAAADVRALHLGVGVLTPNRLDALAPLLGSATLRSLRLAYGLGSSGPYPGAGNSGASGTIWRLQPFTRRGLVESVASRAREHGLQIDRCGCAAQCHLDLDRDRDRDRKRPALVPFQQQSLFASVAG